MVLAPYNDLFEAEQEKQMKTSGFDPKRDSIVKVDLIKMAKKLNDIVDMSEHEFRLLM